MSLNLLTSLKIEDRTTPSDRLSGVWIEAALAFGFMISGIIGFIVIFFWLIMPQWRLQRDYKETQCKVVARGIDPMPNNDLYRPKILIEYAAPTPLASDKTGKTILKKYSVWTYDFNTLYNSGYSYQKKEAYNALEAYKIGKDYVCWYDPHDPKNVVLFRNWSWTNITLLIAPISLILLGLGPLIHLYMYRSGRAVKKSVLQSDALQSNSTENSEDSPPEISSEKSSESELDIDLPNVPSIRNIIDSPGVKMNYRLPLDNSPIWSLGVLLLLLVAWGVMCIVLVSIGLGGLLDGRPDWVVTIFIILFGLIWFGLFLYFFRNLQLATSISPTLIEINDALLHLGQTTTALVIQMGGHYVITLDVNLICEEEAAFSYGTDIRREKRVVYRSNLVSEKDFNIVANEQFEKSFEFTIPEDRMHSFDSPHNRIAWRLEVCGEVKNLPPFTRSYVLVVKP